MKKRIAAAAVCMLILTLLSLLAAYNLDCLASHSRAFSSSPMTALEALGNRKVLIFFLLFTALSGLTVSYMAFGRSTIKYRSGMRQIVPGVETPMPEGQGQYGTARWMPKENIPKAFTVVRIDRDSRLIRQLLAEGEDDLR